MAVGEHLGFIVSIGIALWASITDFRHHKIKNYTVLTGLLAGVVLNITSYKAMLLGFGFGLSLILLYAVKMMGAGDVKLLAAIGSLVCFPQIVNVVLYAFVFIGIFILVAWIKGKSVGASLKEIATDMKLSLFTQRIVVAKNTKDKRVPMAGAVLLAVITVYAMNALGFYRFLMY